MSVSFIIIVVLVLLGHAVLWISCANRIHSTNWPRKLLDLGVNSSFAVLFALPCWIAWWFFREGFIPVGNGSKWLEELPLVIQVYFGICVALALIGIFTWIGRRYWHHPESPLLSSQVTSLDFRKVGQPAANQASWIFRLMVRLPGNEVLRPSLVEREIKVPWLPEELDGLVITHISDMHLNGRIGWRYFEEVIALSNRQQPDFVMITGDLIDRSPLIERLAEMLGKLEASSGRYFILGNHDRRIDNQRLRRCLSQAGLTDLSGYCDAVTVRGQQLFIAGNEAPWFLPAGDFDAAAESLSEGGKRPLRILLSHSPDQIDWAVTKDVDLMLAGHLHGGQICLPLIGPIRSPSRYGFEYIGGVYYRHPTVLCVSRGISGEVPLRWNCPPELVKLTLRSK